MAYNHLLLGLEHYLLPSIILLALQLRLSRMNSPWPGLPLPLLSLAAAGGFIAYALLEFEAGGVMPFLTIYDINNNKLNFPAFAFWLQQAVVLVIFAVVLLIIWRCQRKSRVDV